MNPEATTAKEDIGEILRRSFDDHRLSRGERQVLQAAIQELAADEQQLAVLRQWAFAIVREELAGPLAGDSLSWLEDVLKALLAKPVAAVRPAEAYFSPGDACVNAICGQLRRVQRTAEICVFTITDDRIADAIDAARHRRVNIRIITDDEKSADLGSDIGRLTSRGIPVRFDRSAFHMHHKFAIFDRATLLSGSYNWTRGAAEGNQENIVVFHDPQLTRRFADEFERLWLALA